MPPASLDADYHIRRMTRAELDLVMEWAAAEGWNPGLNDAECYWQLDPQGLLVGELGGEVIAAIAASAYGATLGLLSLYIVRPQFRGQGYGLALWQAAMSYLDGRTVGLDAVAAQQENYARSGFKAVYRNLYYLGHGGGPAPAGIVSLSSGNFAEVVAYDAAFFPTPRTRFLGCWLNPPAGAARGVFDHGNLAGYGVIRPCHRGYKIGPLFADNLSIAASLLQGLIAQVPGRAVVISIAAANPQALELVRGARMWPVYETIRMYTRGEPQVPMTRLYAPDIA